MALVKAKTARSSRQAAPEALSRAMLAAELENADAEGRRRAARQLLDRPVAGDDLDLLLGRLPRERDASVRAAMMTALIRRGDRRAVNGLAGFLRSEDVVLRNEAMEALRAMAAGGGQVAGVNHLLTELLHDPDADVRIFALNIAEAVRHPDVEIWLIGAIERDMHVNVCATALDMLCEIGTEASIDALSLLKARFPEDAYIQFGTDLALKRIREI